jgi:hypothetical protein
MARLRALDSLELAVVDEPSDVGATHIEPVRRLLRRQHPRSGMGQRFARRRPHSQEHGTSVFRVRCVLHDEAAVSQSVRAKPHRFDLDEPELGELFTQLSGVRGHLGPSGLADQPTGKSRRCLLDFRQLL